MLPLLATLAASIAAVPAATGTEAVTRMVAPRAAAVQAPPIVKRWVPYGLGRRRQMAAYSQRHYGQRTHRLEPKVIVEHFTQTNTTGSAWRTFAANSPDVEFHELPGVCAHFLIERSGRILSTAPIGWRCRHTVGLNHRAIGIEHVGMSDSQVMGNRRQLAASLKLTAWLRCRYGIANRDVIGHNESLSSRWYHERVKAFRGRTHDDMKPATMRRYRQLVARTKCS
ncbi:MAG: peptidoglycan recognition family protein [Actinomycetes bacterium]